MTINAGLNKEEFVRPEQAYQAYVDLMKKLIRPSGKIISIVFLHE